MKISEAETYVRRYTRNGSDSSRYPTDAIHVAIQSVAQDFIFRTHCLVTADLALSANSAALPSLPSDFLPENLRRAYIAGLTAAASSENGKPPELAITEHGELYDRQLNRPCTSFPQALAFETQTTGIVYPTPDAAYTLRLLYEAPFTSWTPGSPLLLPAISGGAVASVAVNSSGVTTYGSTPTVTISGGGGTGATATATLTATLLTAIVVTAGGTGYTSVPTISVNGVVCNDLTLNLPDSYLKASGGILTDGCRANLQGSEPENAALVRQSRADYDAFVVRRAGRGSGGLGEQVLYRAAPWPTRTRCRYLRGGL